VINSQIDKFHEFVCRMELAEVIDIETEIHNI
jgi:hypothetical protein